MYECTWIIVNNFFKFYILGILFNAIMYKCRFYLANWVYLFKRIHTNFILYFSKFSMILNFEPILKFK
jgi:hypothetical protein